MDPALPGKIVPATDNSVALGTLKGMKLDESNRIPGIVTLAESTGEQGAEVVRWSGTISLAPPLG
jgi:hypothetical protein